jgi:hypothetical protein
MRSFAHVVLALLVALPAAAQERGGLSMRNNLYSELNQIEANRGCPQSVTSVTVGVNKSFGLGSSAQQQLANQNAGGGTSGCRPLVSTQVVAGANLALGGGSNAGQSIQAQGPRGLLATNTYTRGYNVGFGAGSIATQRLSNLTGR